MADVEVLGIAGSLRAGSYNRGLLRAAQELAPPGMVVRIWEGLREIPPYDADVEALGDPPPVAALRLAVASAGALLVATPEYNHSVPGVLKNAIDWVSRPPASTPLAGKVAAILGASPGPMGTVRAQVDLREILRPIGVSVVPAPEVMVSNAAQHFDTAGRLVDEATRKRVAALLVELARWRDRLAGSGAR